MNNIMSMSIDASPFERMAFVRILMALIGWAVDTDTRRYLSGTDSEALHNARHPCALFEISLFMFT